MNMCKRIRLILFVMMTMTTISVSAQTNELPYLDARQQAIVRISALTGRGDLSKLKTELNTGLDAGLTISQIKETLIHVYAYAGFPRSIRGLQTFMAVLDERKAKNINDKIGNEASEVNDPRNKYERGKAILDSLLGTPQNGPRTGYAAFAPQIELFLKEHLFADIFERDVLTYAERELVTVSVLAGIGGAEPMLESHLKICLNIGLTPEQLRQFAKIIKTTIGTHEAESVQIILAKILKDKTQSTQKVNHPNPFTLVYQGAIPKNEKGKVNIHPVTYKIKNITIAANVYTPANYDAFRKYPTIVVAHPNGGVKEQVAGLYAQRLAEQGYITIAADAAYQGASGGEPRNIDKPANRIEDIHGMADFITQYAGVDASRLGVLGICGGGGYSLKAAQSDKRFKAVATLSMFNSGQVRRNGFMNSQASTIQERLKQATDARAQEAAGGNVIYTGLATPTDEEITRIPTDLYREGYVYYYRTHTHPNSTFKYTMSSLLDLMTFDAATNMDLINQPLLMIAGSKADSFYMTDEAFKKATNSKNKELFLIDGATHIQTYWKPEYVSQAVNKLLNFYQTTL